MGIWRNDTPCSFLAKRQSIHYTAGSGREQDSTRQRWAESQVETGIWQGALPFDQPTRAEMELVAGIVSPKETSQTVPNGRDSSWLQIMCCV